MLVLEFCGLRTTRKDFAIRTSTTQTTLEVRPLLDECSFWFGIPAWLSFQAYTPCSPFGGQLRQFAVWFSRIVNLACVRKYLMSWCRAVKRVLGLLLARWWWLELLQVGEDPQATKSLGYQKYNDKTSRVVRAVIKFLYSRLAASSVGPRAGEANTSLKFNQVLVLDYGEFTYCSHLYLQYLTTLFTFILQDIIATYGGVFSRRVCSGSQAWDECALQQRWCFEFLLIGCTRWQGTCDIFWLARMWTGLNITPREVIAAIHNQQQNFGVLRSWLWTGQHYQGTQFLPSPDTSSRH